MSQRWSADSTVAEHRDLQASAMAVDYTGNIVLLAGRRHLALKRLDENNYTLKKIQRTSKYEVASVEWAPSAVYKHICAIACNQQVEIVSWESGEPNTTSTLKSHTRVISDINWHRHDPNLLASCSVDTYTHIWDIRDGRRPILSMTSVSGASQVRWNRISNHILATSHDGDIKLWDQRKSTSPVQYITAHLSRIHGIDWSPNSDHHLATSSQDGTVKFFDIHNTRRPDNVLNTAAPVWRARYTPFGDGLVTVVVPQLRRGENYLQLWNVTNQSAPVHTFVGHTDVVLEFCWRPQDSNSTSTDHELVTWSRDQSLRVWKVDAFMQKLCGHEADEEHMDLENEDDASNHLCNGPSHHTNVVDPVVAVPCNLQQELSLLDNQVSNIEMDVIDITKRTCTITINANNHTVVLQISFPNKYPSPGFPPVFHFGLGTSLDSVQSVTLMRLLKATANDRTKKARPCMEACLRRLVLALERSNDTLESRTRFKIPKPEPELYIGLHDARVPFPRTSGAKWGHIGFLVVFGRPPNARRQSIKNESYTPRSLSALGGPHGTMVYNGRHSNRSTLSISSFYFQDHLKNSKRTRTRTISAPGTGVISVITPKPIRHMVTVYDANTLFFINKRLAESYIIKSRSLAAMCAHNAAMALECGRTDLHRTWTLAGLMGEVPTSNSGYADSEDDVPWPYHPFGSSMLHSLITHYAKIGDVQTAAMLCCAFDKSSETSKCFRQNSGSKSVNHSHLASGKWLKPGGSPYHTIHPIDTKVEGWNIPTFKQHRSNSWSDSMDECRIESEIVRPVTMLNHKHVHLYDEYKKAYAEILYRWKLLITRTEIIKSTSTNLDIHHRGVEFLAECSLCGRSARGPQCPVCRRTALHCSVCRLAVKGSTSCCLQCGHGGHTIHLQEWFKTQIICPTGCGCNCLEESNDIFDT